MSSDPTTVPIVRDSIPWLILDRYRVSALHEAASAPTNEACFEAVVVANRLYESQSDLIGGFSKELEGEYSQYDPDRDIAVKYLSAWMEQPHIAWMERQNELLGLLGRDVAEPILNERSNPRLRTIFAEVRGALEERVVELGGDPDAIRASAEEPADPDHALGSDAVPTNVEAQESAALKTCPDCAEDVKAAARKCRFCGYRFDGASADST